MNKLALRETSHRSSDGNLHQILMKVELISPIWQKIVDFCNSLAGNKQYNQIKYAIM